MSSRDYYNTVYNTAIELGANPVQAQLAASQASLETGYGKHVKGNNHFGIKAGSKYKGKTVSFNTHEVLGGKRVGMKDTFRAYEGLAGSVKGYMEFMGKAFPRAWNAPNVSTAAKELKNGRYGSYATDPKYAQKIASISDKFGVADPSPVERVQLADLPTVSERPSLADQLGYEPGGILAPETAGSFNPVSSAQAGEMPNGGLLVPTMRPQAEPTSLLDQKGATPNPAINPANRSATTPPVTPPRIFAAGLDGGPDVVAAQPTSLLDQKGGMPAPPTLEEYQQGINADVAANPESMLPEEALMSQPVAPMLPPPTRVAPAPSLLPAPQDPYTLQQAPQPVYTPPPPQNSGMDVWNGNAMSGVDNTGQYELNRAGDGNIYRYSDKYDRTDILNPDGSYRGQKSGKIEGPAESTISSPSFGNPFGPASTRSGAMVRGVLGSTVGGALGGMAGPVGSLAGSLIGRNLAQGQGLLSLQGAASKMTPGHYGPITANTFPDAPNQAGFLTSRRSRNNSSLYDPNASGLSAAEEAARRNSISPAAAAHVARGGGGLF